LRNARGQRVHPDVLISDIGMPEEDGYQFMGRVRALEPQRGGNIPAVALTAFATRDDRQRALDCGFQAHVPKPVEVADLIAIVAGLVERGSR
jgi:CheY-like chemotaxis protein